MTFHNFHLVERRPWPLFGSLRAFLITTGLLNFIHINNINYLFLGLIFTLLIILQWWRDIIREATFQGFHTLIVKNRIKWGIILFIVREILFFFRFFWRFFHSSLSPDIEIGIVWPPAGILAFNPFQIPLLNTVILLASGISVTWTHHRIIEKNFNQAWISLLITIFLGVYFTILQAFEYWEAIFTISDNTYGTTFFVATGFHGLHVLIGTTFFTSKFFTVISKSFS